MGFNLAFKGLIVLVDYFDMLILVMIMVYIIVKYKHFACFS